MERVVSSSSFVCFSYRVRMFLTYTNGIMAKATDDAGIRNTLFIKTATTAPTAKRTNADEQTKANFPSLPQDAKADCRYSSFAPIPFFFFPALSAFALSRRFGFFEMTDVMSCEICCGVRFRKHTIAMIKNMDAINRRYTRNQLPSLRICSAPAGEHRTVEVSFSDCLT